MSNIVISLGVIPAKLDAVKYIGNKFNGGLILRLALELSELGHSVEIVKWKYNKIDTTGVDNVHNVDDINEYQTFMQLNHYDIYILGAAVANLMPVEPWKGKFPSHNYSEGDEINIKFKICPRIINQIKKNHPRSTLIGFKLSTGSYLDAFETLKESNADLVIYNNPSDLDKITFCYKTFQVKDGIRSDIADRIDDLSKINYFTTRQNLENLNNNLDIKPVFLIKELEKYVLDENNHGSIGVVQNELGTPYLYTHSRYDKHIGIYGKGLVYDNEFNARVDYKLTEALPVFLKFMGLNDGYKYFIHTHKGNYKHHLEVGYIPPNASEESVDDIINKGKFIETIDGSDLIIIKSECHGYFMAFKNLEDVLNTLSNRNWTKYDPPTRYVNDNSDIFNDILNAEKFQGSVGLEIGGNSSNLSKVFEKLNLSVENFDPYFDDNKSWPIGYFNQCELIVAKNCAPIIGLNSLELYSQLSKRMLFNFPKQYICDRVVVTVSGDIKREISYHISGIVFHSLTLIKGEGLEPDVFHSYEMLTKENVYNRFHKQFEIMFRETENGVWCYMKKR